MKNNSYKECKRVNIKTKSMPAFVGYIYLSKDERLQDLLNDPRQFIPIQIISTDLNNPDLSDSASFKTLIIQKTEIISIEDKN